MKNLVVILARKNSKRLKNKNLRILGNRPLISWTIDFCKKIFDNDNILLSTDCEKIYNLAKKSKIVCPWIRPKYLSTSKASSEDACIHALNWYEKKFGKVDSLILMQPTSPFRDITEIKKGINLFYKKKRNVIAISELDKIKFSYSKNDKEKFIIINNLMYPSKNRKKKLYKINGNFYITSPKKLRKFKEFKAKKSIPLIINSVKRSMDVDTIEDLNICKKFIRN